MYNSSWLQNACSHIHFYFLTLSGATNLINLNFITFALTPTNVWSHTLQWLACNITIGYAIQSAPKVLWFGVISCKPIIHSWYFDNIVSTFTWDSCWEYVMSLNSIEVWLHPVILKHSFKNPLSYPTIIVASHNS